MPSSAKKIILSSSSTEDKMRFYMRKCMEKFEMLSK
jgi:hypothetical protein